MSAVLADRPASASPMPGLAGPKLTLRVNTRPPMAVRTPSARAPGWAARLPLEAAAPIVEAVLQGDVGRLKALAARVVETLDRGGDDTAPLASLWAEIAACEAAAMPASIDESQVWLLRRPDGSNAGTLRLRADGTVGLYPHPNESRWSLERGVLRLHAADGRPTSEYRLCLSKSGRPFFVGVWRDMQTLHVLSELRCDYARIANVDPERPMTLSRTPLVRPEPANAGELQRAVLLAAPRTGSHLLLNLLNSSRRVFFDAELMNYGKVSLFGSDLDVERSGPLNGLRAIDPVGFCKLMLARSFHADGRMLEGIRVRGFKLFPAQSPAVANWALDDAAVKIVHLWRRNALAQYSSLRFAFDRGHWVGGPQALKASRIAFERDRFLRYLDARRDSLEALRSRFAERGGNVEEIEYGRFTREHLDRVLGFLTGDPTPSAPLSSLGLSRQLNERVIDRFENPDDVARCLEEIGCPDWAGIEGGEVSRI